MPVLYIIILIILGIIVGVPAYLFLNMLLMLVCRLIAGTGAFLWPYDDDSFMSEIKGDDGSLVESVGRLGKVVGWGVFIIAVLYLVVGLIGRLVWLVCQACESWFEFIKFCWNLGSETKSKTETKTKSRTK